MVESGSTRIEQFPERGHVGRRPRTVYTITTLGRQTLSRWLIEPGAGPVIECEAVLKVFFAEHGTRSDVLGSIGAMRRWAEHELAENVMFARLYTETGGPFPERAAPIALTDWDTLRAIAGRDVEPVELPAE